MYAPKVLFSVLYHTKMVLLNHEVMFITKLVFDFKLCYAIIYVTRSEKRDHSGYFITTEF